MRQEMNNDLGSGVEDTLMEKREVLSSEALKVGEKMQEVIKTTLLIGGSVALGYLVYRQLRGKKKGSGMLMSLMGTVASALMTPQGRELISTGKEKITRLLAK